MGNQLDPTIVALTKAIGMQEHKGRSNPYDFSTVGPDGERGAYQMTPDWIAANAPKYLKGNYDPQNLTSAQQDELAYKVVESRGKAGLSPAEIASEWNSGNKDAYKQNHVGTSPGGAQYDTPGYVNNVSKYYEQSLAQTKSGYAAPNQSGSARTPVQGNSYAPPSPPSALTSTGTPDQAPPPQKNLLQMGADFFAPVLGDIGNALQGKNDKSLGQWAGDIGTTALSVGSLIPGLGELGPVESTLARLGLAGAKGVEGANVVAKATPTLLKTVGKNAALGASFGVSGALGQGETDPTKLAQGGLVGGLTGGALGAGGVALGKLSEVLPQRIVRSFIPGINEDTAKYATTRSLGSPSSMLKESDASLSQLGSSLGEKLKNPQYDYIQPNGQEILSKVVSSFPQSGMGATEIVANLKRLVPLKGALVDKLASGADMTLTELHDLNSAIGKATYKSVFDDPAMKAGKEIANSAYHTISDVITKAAPETKPIFDQMSKEYSLNAGLAKAVRSGQKAKAITLRDIIAMMGGFGLSGGNVLAGLGAVGLEKAATSPTVNLKAAGLISKLKTPLSKNIGKGLNVAALRGVTSFSH